MALRTLIAAAVLTKNKKINIMINGIDLVNACLYAVNKKDTAITDKLKSLPEGDAVIEKIESLKESDNPEYRAAQHAKLIELVMRNISELPEVLAEYEEKLDNYFSDFKKIKKLNKNINSTKNIVMQPGGPSFTKMATNFTKAAIDFAKSGFSMASEEKRSERLAVCSACPRLDSAAFGGAGRCLECGCNVDFKTRPEAAACPLKKW